MPGVDYGEHVHLSEEQIDDLRQHALQVPANLNAALPTLSAGFGGLPIFAVGAGHDPEDADGDAGVAFVRSEAARLRSMNDLFAMIEWPP